jgi:hypothetical protein
MSSERRFEKADRRRRQHKRSFWERYKPYAELTMVLIVTALLIIAAITYSYYSTLK